MHATSSIGFPPRLPVMKPYLDVSALRFRCPAVLLAHHVFVTEWEDVIQNPLIIRAPFCFLQRAAEVIEDNHLREGNGT